MKHSYGRANTALLLQGYGLSILERRLFCPAARKNARKSLQNSSERSPRTHSSFPPIAGGLIPLLCFFIVLKVEGDYTKKSIIHRLIYDRNTNYIITTRTKKNLPFSHKVVPHHQSPQKPLYHYNT